MFGIGMLELIILLLIIAVPIYWFRKITKGEKSQKQNYCQKDNEYIIASENSGDSDEPNDSCATRNDVIGSNNIVMQEIQNATKHNETVVSQCAIKLLSEISSDISDNANSFDSSLREASANNDLSIDTVSDKY